MMFDTFQYWLFFAATLAVLAFLRHRPAKVVLVVASFVFYGFWDWRFCALLAASIVANYLFGLAIDRREGAARKRAVTLAVVFNLGVLGFFKYANFFIDSFASLFGVDANGMLLNIVLPVGISFFTFEGIAYAVDIYRRQMRAVRDPVDFSLFISFFPHLVAGPIIRPMDFFPQLSQRDALTSEDSRWGMREILKGLIKKVAFANWFAPIADAWYTGTLYQDASVPAWAGVLAFSMQIYFDFSGYTDIARGCARLLGYRFPPNFERPYLSSNPTEFWRRWHISLSFWLRDYLYISLGGNRRGVPRTYLNLLIVMGLGGLWHGASWNFGIWGLYHGFLMVWHRLWRKAISGTRAEKLVDSRWLTPLWISLTFVIVTLGWIPFRAPDFASSMATFSALLQPQNWDFASTHPAILIVPIGTLIFCLIDRDRRWQDWLVERASLPTAALAGALALLFLEVFAQIDAQVPFVYFQF
ncbi:MAG: MBOAT family O-acyltransferase [Rhodanobacter sp.]